MKKVSLSAVFIACSLLLAAQKRAIFSIGPELSISTYHAMPSNGIGGSAGVQLHPNKKISFVADIGYNRFSGQVVNIFTKDTVNSFAIMPVLAGARYTFRDKFYFAVRAGYALGAHNARGSLAFSPAAGWVVFGKNKPLLDFGLRWIGLLPTPSYPENTFLNKGGYSYLNLRIAYLF